MTEQEKERLDIGDGLGCFRGLLNILPVALVFWAGIAYLVWRVCK